MRIRCGLLLALSLALWGCNRPATEHLAEARAAMSDTAYEDALAAADAGLAAPGLDEPTRWGLELVQLEALARSGQGGQTRDLVSELAGRHPDRFPSAQYAATAVQLEKAGDGPAAIEVLDLGMKHHPGDPMIAQLISAQQSGEVGSAELEMLRTLGYVE
jgi:hypothetical protein